MARNFLDDHDEGWNSSHQEDMLAFASAEDMEHRDPFYSGEGSEGSEEPRWLSKATSWGHRLENWLEPYRSRVMVPAQRIPWANRWMPGLRAIEWLAAAGLVVAHLIVVISAVVGHLKSGNMKDMSKDMGGVLQFDIAAVLFLGLRNSPVRLLLGVSAEKMYGWHAFIYALLMVFGCAHGAVAVAYYWGSASKMQKHLIFDVENFTGIAAWLVFLVLGLLSLPPVRRRLWEGFRLAHVLAAVAIVLLFFHHSGSDMILISCLAFLPFYLVDWLLRLLSLRHTATLLDCRSAGTLTRLEIRAPHIAKALLPVQHVLLNMPELSAAQQHPFSAVPSPTAHDSVYLFVRALGGWTRELQRLGPSLVYSHPRLEGPYGHLTTPLHRYPHVVLVSGGAGLAPHLSILSYLRNSAPSGSLPGSVTVIWVSRDLSELPLFQELMTQRVEHVAEEWQVYCTGKGVVLPRDHDSSAYSVFQGRPDFLQVLQPSSLLPPDALYSSRVGLYVAGPASLVEHAVIAAVRLRVYDVETEVSEL